MPTHCIWLVCLPALAELSVQVIPSQDLISDEPSQHTSQAGPWSLFHQLESGARTLRRLVSTCQTSQGKGCLDEDPDFKSHSSFVLFSLLLFPEQVRCLLILYVCHFYLCVGYFPSPRLGRC